MVLSAAPAKFRDQIRRPHAAELARAALSIGLGLASQLSGLGLLATSAWLITTASLRPPILTLTVAIASVRLFALLRGVGRYGERLASHDLALRLLARLRVWAFRQLQPLVPGGLGTTSGGDLLSRVVSDVDSVQDLVVRILVPLATGIGSAAAGVALAVLILPPAGLALGVGLAVAGMVIPYLARVAGRRASEPLAAQRGRVGGQIVEALEGAADILSFGATQQTLTDLTVAEFAVARTALRSAAVVGVAVGLAALTAGTTTIVVVAIGAEAVATGRLSGVGVAVLGFVALASFEAVQSLPEVWAHFDSILGAAQRVGGLAALAPPVVASPAVIPIPTGPSTLCLQRASVCYVPHGPCAIRGIDLNLAPGRRVALLGASGAGKTTVALALLRFVELSAGRSTLNGADVRILGSEQVRQQIAWAPQDPHIFAASVAANLRLARPDADDAQLIEVLESLGLGGWLQTLDRGLDTVLGEHGATVSGGQRQRIGLARALLSERPILVLDEPTAHLDDSSERLVRQQVLASTEARALLWITHRVSGLEAFDEVLVLECGRGVERGTAAQLLARGGTLAELVADATPSLAFVPN